MFGTVASHGPPALGPGEKWVSNTAGMISGEAKTEVFGGDPAQLPLCPPQIPLGLPYN